MKKIISMLLITALLSIFAGCYENEPIISRQDLEKKNKNQTDVTDVRRNLSCRIFGDSSGTTRGIFNIDLPFLLNSEIIIIGEFVNETESGFKYYYDEQLKKEFPDCPESFSQLLISEVLKGDVCVGDIITVRQEYAVDEKNGILMTYDDHVLTPMRKGDRWIYFLNTFNSLEYYTSLGHELGIKMAEKGIIYSTVGFGGRYPVPTWEMAKSVKEFPREAGIFFMGDENKTEENWRKLNDANERILEEVDFASFGVFSKNEFSFSLYAEVLDHFKIQPQDRVNPGRDFDAKLVEIVEKQFQESYAECLD